MSEIKKALYTPKQKKCIDNYREKNRDKINQQAKKDYLKSKANPDQMEKRRLYAIKYRQMKKEREDKEYWERITRQMQEWVDEKNKGQAGV